MTPADMTSALYKYWNDNSGCVFEAKMAEIEARLEDLEDVIQKSASFDVPINLALRN